jgi:hypothetical protein
MWLLLPRANLQARELRYLQSSPDWKRRGIYINHKHRKWDAYRMEIILVTRENFRAAAESVGDDMWLLLPRANLQARELRYLQSSPDWKGW